MRRLATIFLILIATSAAAQEIDPLTAAREAMARYEYSKAIGLLDKAMEQAPEEATVRDLALQKARCQKKLLRYDAAAETLASVMKPGMLDVEVAGELADCHVLAGKLPDAFTLYNFLSMQHPDNLYFAIQKASLLFKLNDFEGCLDEGKAICAKDSIPSILSLVGASALKLGQVDTALTYYRKSLSLNPLNPGTVTSISNILLGKKDYDGVIDLTKGFLEEVPDNLSVGQILGVAYYLKDDQDNAYEVFKQLRKVAELLQFRYFCLNFAETVGCVDEIIACLHRCIIISLNITNVISPVKSVPLCKECDILALTLEIVAVALNIIKISAEAEIFKKSLYIAALTIAYDIKRILLP